MRTLVFQIGTMFSLVYSKDECVIAFSKCRFDPKPESGWSRGLTVVLDAHTDLIAASSIPEYFQVMAQI